MLYFHGLFLSVHYYISLSIKHNEISAKSRIFYTVYWIKRYKEHKSFVYHINDFHSVSIGVINTEQEIFASFPLETFLASRMSQRLSLSRDKRDTAYSLSTTFRYFRSCVTLKMAWETLKIKLIQTSQSHCFHLDHFNSITLAFVTISLKFFQSFKTLKSYVSDDVINDCKKTKSKKTFQTHDLSKPV